MEHLITTLKELVKTWPSSVNRDLTRRCAEKTCWSRPTGKHWAVAKNLVLGGNLWDVVAPPCFHHHHHQHHQHHHHHVVARLVLPQKPTLLQPQYINDLNAWVFCTPARCCGPALFCLRSTTLLCCATKFKQPLPNDPRFVRGSHILRRYCNRYASAATLQ